MSPSGPDSGIAPSTAFAAALLAAFARLGIRDVVLAPGSRSQALALVAAVLEEAGAVRLRVRIDERSAGFLALGLARESGVPAIVVTTSGTAVANLHPAVLEAYHSGVPMIVLSADRPEELHGIGANQTTKHVGMFGDAIRRTWDIGAPVGEPGEVEAADALAADVARAAASGPVHLNVAFADPLSSTLPLGIPAESVLGVSGAGWIPADSGGGEVLELGAGPRTTVIAGAGAGAGAEALARELGAVLFAEAVSGARFGPNLVVPYREVIRDPAFLDALERIVVLGRPTLSREVPWLIERGAVETIVVRGPGADDYNPGRVVARFVDAVTVAGDLDAAAARAWLGPWVARSRAHLDRSDDLAPVVDASQGEKARHELAAVRRPVTRRALVEAVWRSSWPHVRLVVSSSRLVRVLVTWAPGKAIPVHANRGLAGIDVNVSTAIGIALAHSGSGITRLLTGDLAFLHDAGGLAFGVGEERPRIMIVVGNDGGGTIFDDLEVAALRDSDALSGSTFDRVMLTPQTASIEGLARAYGWEYRRVERRGDLDPALSSCTGPTVVEVPLPRT